MREKIRTVGISVVLDAPVPPSSVSSSSQSSTSPSSLKRSPAEEDDWARDGDLRGPGSKPNASTGSGSGVTLGGLERGSKRGRAFNFDLGVESVWAVGRPEGE